jgi:excisionase family DNA binding protein
MALEKQTFTVEEAAKILGIGRGAAYEAVRTGTIPAIRLSPRRIVVPRGALARMLGEDRST